MPAWPPHEGKSADREAAKVWGGEMAECHWLVSRITQRQSMGAPSGGESRRVLAKEALFHGRGYDYSPGFDLRRLLLRNPLVPLPPATPPSACCRSSPSPTVLPARLTPAFRKKLALRRHLMLFFSFSTNDKSKEGVTTTLRRRRRQQRRRGWGRERRKG